MKKYTVNADFVQRRKIEVEAESESEAEDIVCNMEGCLGCTGAEELLYVVRLYDGFDNIWIDICKPCKYEEAQKIWNKKTENGTKNTCYADIDYYAVYPADTRMMYS